MAGTERIRLEGWYEYQVRDYRGEPGVAVGLGPQREDKYNFAGLNRPGRPTRNWQVGLGFVYSNRNSKCPRTISTIVTACATSRFGF